MVANVYPQYTRRGGCNDAYRDALQERLSRRARLSGAFACQTNDTTNALRDTALLR